MKDTRFRKAPIRFSSHMAHCALHCWTTDRSASAGARAYYASMTIAGGTRTGSEADASAFIEEAVFQGVGLERLLTCIDTSVKAATEWRNQNLDDLSSLPVILLILSRHSEKIHQELIQRHIAQSIFEIGRRNCRVHASQRHALFFFAMLSFHR